jgi:hypothetical protein
MGQEKPGKLCIFDGFGANPKLAEIATPESTIGYYGCSSPTNCLPAKLAPGAPVVVFQVEGDWTCGYLSQHDGAGPGWVRSKDIRPVPFDPNPSPDAWAGTWANGEGRIRIRRAETPGKLKLQGTAVWHGLKNVVHTGGFDGEATPDGHHLHFSEAGAYSCMIDLTLIGKYLVADDNDRCGGANVRFWSVWMRAP